CTWDLDQLCLQGSIDPGIVVHALSDAGKYFGFVGDPVAAGGRHFFGASTRNEYHTVAVAHDDIAGAHHASIDRHWNVLLTGAVLQRSLMGDALGVARKIMSFEGIAVAYGTVDNEACDATHARGAHHDLAHQRPFGMALAID